MIQNLISARGKDILGSLQCKSLANTHFLDNVFSFISSVSPSEGELVWLCADSCVHMGKFRKGESC